MLSTSVPVLFTEQVGYGLSHAVEQDIEGATAKDPCVAVECRVGYS